MDGISGKLDVDILSVSVGLSFGVVLPESLPKVVNVHIHSVVEVKYKNLPCDFKLRCSIWPEIPVDSIGSKRIVPRRAERKSAQDHARELLRATCVDDREAYHPTHVVSSLSG